MEQKRSKKPGRPPGPTDHDVYRRAIELYYDGYRPAEILAKLVGEFGATRVPALVTVRRWISDLGDDGTPTWSPGARPRSTDRVDEAVVVEVAAFLVRGNAPWPRISEWQAVVMTRLRRARPQLPVSNVWHLTRQLIQAQQMLEKEEDRAEAQVIMSGALAFLADPSRFEQGVKGGIYPASIAGTAIKEFTLDAVIAADGKMDFGESER
jgi:hypothetical protein